MKTSITRAPGNGPMKAGCMRAVGLALAIACILTTPPLRAEEAHRGGQQHSQGRAAPRQAVRHDDHRRGGHGYGDQNDDYGYGAPPVVYAPGAVPGISLFLPL